MKPAHRSTASLVLTVLALALGFVFSGWCVALAVSIEDLRRQVQENMTGLFGLEDVRTGLLTLERVVLERHDLAQPTTAWKDEYMRVQAGLDALRAAENLAPQVRAALDELDRALASVNESAAPLLAGRPDDPARPDRDDAFHRANIAALEQTAAAISSVRVEQRTISSTLARQWRSLFVLAAVSVAAVIVLALLFRHARRDAEKHREAEEQLRDSEERLASVLAAVPDLIIVLGNRGRYRDIYTAKPELLYNPAEQLLGRSIHDVLPGEPAARIQDVIDRTLDTGELQSFEYPLSIADETKWFSARVAPFGSPDDPCVLWVARDMTAQRQAETQLQETEARFRQLAENIDEVVSMSPAGSRGVEYVSPAYETIFGRPCQSLYDDPYSWHELIHPDDRERVIAAFEAHAPDGTFDEEFRIVRDDGSIRWIRDRTFPIRDARNKLYRIAGLSQDITEAKQAEDELRQREELFRSVLDTANDAVLVADERGTVVLWNKASEKILGYSADEAIGRPLSMIIPQRFHTQHNQDLREARAGEGSMIGRTTERIGLRKDGTEIPVELSVGRWRTPDGAFFTGIVRDISERKKAEQALRESEMLLRQLTENIREVFWMTSPDGHEMIYVSPGYEQIWGRTCQSLYDHPSGWSDAIHEDDRQRIAKAFYEGAAHAGFDQEYRIVRPDGSIRWIRDRGFTIRDEDGAVQRIAGIAEDITVLVRHRDELEAKVQARTAALRAANEQLAQENVERRRAEKIQRDRNRVLQLLAKGASLEQVLTLLLETMEELDPPMLGSVLLLDEDGKTLRHGAAPTLPAFYNEAIDGLEIGPGVGSCGTAAYTGGRVVVEDVATHPYWAGFRELAARADLRACWSEPIMSSNDEVLGTFAMYYREPRGPDEADLEAIQSAASLAGIAIEHKRAEKELKASHQRLLVADRLASLGTLTAGLGHDMNNVLFPIRCRLGALDWKKVPPDLKDLLMSSRTTVNYLQQLCNGLRLLAVDPEDADASTHATMLGPWWRQVEPLLANLIADDVTLQTELPEDVPPVAVPTHRLTQAVMNLVVNASEAMPDGGRILLWARADDGKGTIQVGVTDEGTGMTRETRLRAFDPFFTTKKRGLSTGFGLSLVHSLARMSSGDVTIDSEPGRGTTVVMNLPAATGSAVRVAGASRIHDHAAVTLADPRQAAWIVNMLESAGYKVRLAADGDPADADLWVTEPTERNLETARAYANTNGTRRIIVLGPAGPEWRVVGAAVVGDAANRHAIHAAVFETATVQP